MHRVDVRGRCGSASLEKHVGEMEKTEENGMSGTVDGHTGSIIPTDVSVRTALAARRIDGPDLLDPTAQAQCGESRP